MIVSPARPAIEIVVVESQSSVAPRLGLTLTNRIVARDLVIVSATILLREGATVAKETTPTRTTGASIISSTTPVREAILLVAPLLPTVGHNKDRVLLDRSMVILNNSSHLQ